MRGASAARSRNKAPSVEVQVVSHSTKKYQGITNDGALEEEKRDALNNACEERADNIKRAASQASEMLDALDKGSKNIAHFREDLHSPGDRVWAPLRVADGVW